MKLVFSLAALMLGSSSFGMNESTTSQEQAMKSLISAFVNKSRRVNIQQAVQAVLAGAEVNALVTRDINPYLSKTTYGMPLINWAAGIENFALVQFLVEQGANINSRDISKNTFMCNKGRQGISAFYTFFAHQFDPEKADWFLMNGVGLNERVSGDFRFFPDDVRVAKNILAWLLNNGYKLLNNDIINSTCISLLSALYQPRSLLLALATSESTDVPMQIMREAVQEGLWDRVQADELEAAVIMAAAQHHPVLADLLDAPEFSEKISEQSLQQAFVRAAVTGNIPALKLILSFAQARKGIAKDPTGWSEALLDALRFADGQNQKEAEGALKTLAEQLMTWSCERYEPEEPVVKQDKGKEKVKEKEIEKKHGEQPAIIQAALNHDLAEIQRLVAEGQDINTPARANQEFWWLEGGNVIWAFLATHHCLENDSEVRQALMWLEQLGADLNHLGCGGFSVISPVEQTFFECLRWLFEHGVTVPPAAMTEDHCARTILQVKAAYSDEFLRAIILAAHSDEQMITVYKHITRLHSMQSVSEDDSNLINRAFILAVAQSNRAYRLIFESFTELIEPTSIGQALLVASARGNTDIVSFLIEHGENYVEEEREEWYEVCLPALMQAIVHKHDGVALRLLNELPAHVVREAIKKMGLGLKEVTGFSRSERFKWLSQLDAASKLGEVGDEHGVRLPQGTASALDAALRYIPSGVISALVTFLFSTAGPAGSPYKW